MKIKRNKYKHCYDVYISNREFLAFISIIVFITTAIFLN